MKLSIVTVCLNSENTISDTIQSVLNQKGVDYEHIIFDGGSVDQTVPLIKSFGNSVNLIQGSDSGIFDAMNQAIKYASGDIIGILNSDDFYVGDTVLKKVRDRIAITGVDSVYGDLDYVKRENVAKIVRKWKAGPFEKSQFRFGWAPPHPTFFVKKEIYHHYGVFDTRYDIAGDYDLMLRLLFKQGISTSYIPEVLVKMRTNGNSDGNLLSRFASLKEDSLAWKRNDLDKGFYTIPCKVLRKIPQYLFKS